MKYCTMFMIAPTRGQSRVICRKSKASLPTAMFDQLTPSPGWRAAGAIVDE